MKAIKHIGIFLVAALLAVSCGVSKVKDISLSSVGIAYVVPTSMRSMDAKLLLGINNPAMSFAVQEITGTIRYEEKPIAHFSTGSIELEGKTDKVYELPCTVALSEKVSLLDLLAIAAHRSMEGLTADVKLRVSLKGGKGTVLTFNGIDLAQFSE